MITKQPTSNANTVAATKHITATRLAAVLATAMLFAGCGDNGGNGETDAAGPNAVTGIAPKEPTVDPTAEPTAESATGQAPSTHNGKSNYKEGGPLRTLVSGMVSLMRPSHDRVVIARSEREFRAMLSYIPIESRREVPIPTDFSDRMVVGLFLHSEYGPGKAFINWMTRSGSTITVLARKQMPGEGCPDPNIKTSPYVVVETQRILGTPKLKLREFKVPC